ncbi:hypothetical protein [Acetobacterium carbinolicum]
MHSQKSSGFRTYHTTTSNQNIHPSIGSEAVSALIISLLHRRAMGELDTD